MSLHAITEFLSKRCRLVVAPKQVRPWPLSGFRQDVRHQISVDPADHAQIHIGDLGQVVDAQITGSSTAVNDLTHPPVFLSLFAGQKIVFHNHRHAWGNVQEGQTF